MQHRRGFFKTLAGIVVGGAGAAVAGPILKLQNKPIPASMTRTYSAITFAQLQEAYDACWFGSDEPNVIYVSPGQMNHIKAKMQTTSRFVARGSDGTNEVTGLVFNNAIITSPRLDSYQWSVNRDEEFCVVNRNKPYAPFSQRFSVRGGRLHSASTFPQIGGSYSRGDSFSISRPEHYEFGWSGFKKA